MSGVRCSARGDPRHLPRISHSSIAPSLPHRHTATRQAYSCIASLGTTVQHRWRQLHDLYDNRQAIGGDARGDRASISVPSAHVTQHTMGRSRRLHILHQYEVEKGTYDGYRYLYACRVYSGSSHR